MSTKGAADVNADPPYQAPQDDAGQTTGKRKSGTKQSCESSAASLGKSDAASLTYPLHRPYQAPPAERPEDLKRHLTPGHDRASCAICQAYQEPPPFPADNIEARPEIYDGRLGPPAEAFRDGFRNLPEIRKGGIGHNPVVDAYLCGTMNDYHQRPGPEVRAGIECPVCAKRRTAEFGEKIKP